MQKRNMILYVHRRNTIIDYLVINIFEKKYLLLTMLFRNISNNDLIKKYNADFKIQNRYIIG